MRLGQGGLVDVDFMGVGVQVRGGSHRWLMGLRLLRFEDGCEVAVRWLWLWVMSMVAVSQ